MPWARSFCPFRACGAYLRHLYIKNIIMADDKKFTEDAYEQALIALFRDELGYAYECGYDVARN